MSTTTDPLTDLLKPDRLTCVIDIGANPIDGDPPYKTMLKKRLCRVVGFEPQEQTLAALNSRKSNLETYLPYAIGDGTEAKLHICRADAQGSELSVFTRGKSRLALGSAFAAVHKRMIAPMLGKDASAALNQLLEANLLKQLALIAHHCYGSYDLATNCIFPLWRKGAASREATTEYGKIMRTQQEANLEMPTNIGRRR